MFEKILIAYYTMSISCLLEDINPIFKIFKICLHRSSGFPGPVFSNIFKILELQDFRFPNIKFLKMDILESFRDILWAQD